MTTLAEFMILSGADNRPPMLEKHMYDSWKSIMELYMQNKEHGRMILESVEHRPLIWPTIKENGVTRTKRYEELSATKKILADCDLKATNIILQGLPTDVYSLERECKLYDAFDKLAHIKGESLHRLPPEWSKFVTDVKLVRDLHTSNFDQLYAYIFKQNELHQMKVILCAKFHDPLALVANHSRLRLIFTFHSSFNIPLNSNKQFSHISVIHHLSLTIRINSSHTTLFILLSIPHLLGFSYHQTPYSNAYTSLVHQDAYPQPQSIPQIEYTVSTVNKQTYLADFPQIDYGLAVHVFKKGNDLLNAINN
ncbi:hypothetical protein Tco_1449550 [Tanacetum coccineum]